MLEVRSGGPRLPKALLIQGDTLAVVAEPRRQQIIQLLWDGEKSAGEIAEALPISFPAVSQHLAKLLEAGVVSVRRDGRRRIYRARKKDLGLLAVFLESMWKDRLSDLKALAEDASQDD